MRELVEIRAVATPAQRLRALDRDQRDYSIYVVARMRCWDLVNNALWGVLEVSALDQLDSLDRLDDLHDADHQGSMETHEEWRALALKTLEEFETIPEEYYAEETTSEAVAAVADNFREVFERVEYLHSRYSLSVGALENHFLSLFYSVSLKPEYSSTVGFMSPKLEQLSRLRDEFHWEPSRELLEAYIARAEEFMAAQEYFSAVDSTEERAQVEYLTVKLNSVLLLEF